MNKNRRFVAGIALLVGATVLTALYGKHAADEENRPTAGMQEEQQETDQAGPHGGRLLTDGALTIELSIVERGEPPRFHAYCLDTRRVSDCSGVSLSVTTHRLTRATEVFRFETYEDHLISPEVVSEPHSFDLVVEAQRDGTMHRWEYASYEGRAQLSAEAIANSAIAVEVAGPAAITMVLPVHGRVLPRQGHITQVVPRYPGVIKELRKNLGDSVAKDEVVAVVESNETLQRYEVRSGIGGKVLERSATLGEYVGEGGIVYTIADLSRLWVELYVPRREASRLHVGQAVNVRLEDQQAPAQTVLGYISPLGSSDTQSVVVRVELANPIGEWRPGWLVGGEIVLEQVEVPVAVRADALQSLGDTSVVFVNQGNIFEARRVQTGRRDRHWVEVSEGISIGESYAVSQSFLLKAEIAKIGASHDH